MEPDKETGSDVDDGTTLQEKRLAEMSSMATFPSQCDTLITEEPVSESKAPEKVSCPVQPQVVPQPQVAPAATLPMVKPSKPSPLSVKPEHKTAFKHFWVRIHGA